MKVKLAPNIFKKLKKLDVRIRSRFKERILIFEKNPNDPQLDNHELRKPYKGMQSIDITNDYRAIYKEMRIGEEAVAYFLTIGTHKDLYGQKSGKRKS